VIGMPLDDDDPHWELHAGGDGHTGPEWREGDRARVAALYASLSGNAKVIFDLMVDHPGECVDADWLAGHLGGRAPGETAERVRHSVSGSLSALNRPHEEPGRRYPFYRWKGTSGEPTQYDMKPHVAALFHAASQARADR
jgi:hypothetical protein